MPHPILRHALHFGEHLGLVFLAREDDPGIIHVFAPLGEDGIRGMTVEESRLVDHLLAQDTVDALCVEAIRAWSSWFDVDGLVIVHNVIEPPERVTPEA